MKVKKLIWKGRQIARKPYIGNENYRLSSNARPLLFRNMITAYYREDTVIDDSKESMKGRLLLKGHVNNM